MRKRNGVLLFVFFGLFIASLLLPGIVGNGATHTTITGFHILMYGWFEAFQGIFGWYANPLAALAVLFLLMHRSKGAVVASLLAIACALQSLLFQGKDVSFIDTNGPFGTLVAGYYVWLSSLVLLLLISYLEFSAKKSVTVPK